jgi:hypothetical protein
LALPAASVALVDPTACAGVRVTARWDSGRIARAAQAVEHGVRLVQAGMDVSCPVFIERGAQWASLVG